MESQKINISALPIAKAEAEELLNQAIEVDEEIQKIWNDNKTSQLIGKIITANILLGFSIEIYLKAFMIGGRKDGVIKDHHLKELYDEFPPFLKSAIKEQYNSYDKSGIEIREFGLMMSKDQPEKPRKEPFEGKSNNFENILEAISNTFVYSRYFFENIKDKDWAVIRYYFDPGKLIALSLQQVLEEGKFREE